MAPFTVRLPLEDGQTDEKKNRNVVESDLAVVCDKTKLDKNGYSGAPTLIVEIVSKSSAKRDNLLKRNKYEKAGVSEYWIVTPETESIMSYGLHEQGNYGEPDMYILGEDEEIKSKVFTDLVIKLKDIFEVWGGPVIITNNGRTQLVIISEAQFEEYENLKARLDLYEKLAEAEAEANAGFEGHRLADVAKELMADLD
ncbi:hypothetical protein SCACP_30640 [Sporomusa carbonis]